MLILSSQSGGAERTSTEPRTDRGALDGTAVSGLGHCFEAGLVADVQPPDLEMRIAILKSHAEAKHLAVSDDVLQLIAQRVQSNIRELEGALVQVIGRTELTHEPLTVQTAQRINVTCDGTVRGVWWYRTAADGTQFSLLHTFDYATEGGFYYAGVIPAPTEGPGGYLYGVTADGGSGGSGQGAIYRIAHDGSGFSVLHSFGPIDSNLANTGGARPRAGLLVGNDGRLYGATQLGGPNGAGVLYRMEVDGSAFTVLYAFSALSRRGTNRSGAYPTGDIVFDETGRLCGTAYAGGGSGFGTVYCLKLPAGG